MIKTSKVSLTTDEGSQNLRWTLRKCGSRGNMETYSNVGFEIANSDRPGNDLQSLLSFNSVDSDHYCLRPSDCQAYSSFVRVSNYEVNYVYL